MDAYSEDLRKKIVEAIEKGGMPEAEAARLLGVGISSVKRYLAAAKAGRSHAPRKRPRKPKMDETAGRLFLEADPEERPPTTVPQGREFLRRVSSVQVSDSTLSRMLTRMGFSRKRRVGASALDRFLREAWKAMVAGRTAPSRFILVDDEWLGEDLAASALHVVEAGRAGALFGAAQLGPDNVTLLSSM